MAMITLTPEHWSNFQKDGQLFEELIGDVLQNNYPQANFSKTKKSWDGGKDHVGSINLIENATSKIWAECKYHHTTNDKNLSIHDVSMTLLMAYIESIHQILIFSYSPINKNFLEYIAKYKNRDDIQVIVYADITLEEYILDSFFTFSDEQKLKYFPKLSKKDIKSFHGGELEFAYKTSMKDFKHEKEEITLTLNDCFNLELYVFNNQNKEQSVTVSLLDIEKFSPFVVTLNGEKDFAKKNHETTFSISAHSSHLIKFSLRLVDTVKEISLPKARIKTGTLSKTLHIDTPINISWLAETSLIGDEHHKFINKAQELMNKKEGLGYILLYGASGVGKSRVLSELKAIATMQHKKVCYLDSDKVALTSEDFVRSIISTLTEFPLIELCTDENMSTLCDEINIDSTKKRAFEILYSKQFNFLEKTNYIIDLLVALLKKTSSVLLFDNIQNYDETSLNIINLLIDRSECSDVSSLIVLGCNSHRIYQGTHAEKTFKRLKLLHAQFPEKISSFELLGFSKKESIEYVKQCLQFQTSKNQENFSYDNSIEKIVDVCKNNPFYLRNFLLYLEQCDIIRRSKNSSFYIFNIKAFQNVLNDIPDTIETLLNAREQEFLKYLKSYSPEMAEQYLHFVALLSFTKYLPVEVYNKMFTHSSLLQNMKDMGFIIEENRKIIFAHQFIDSLYHIKYPESAISEEILHTFLDSVKKTYHEKELFCPIFLAKYILRIITKDDFKKMSQLIIDGTIAPIYTTNIFRTLVSLINVGEFTISYKDISLLYSRMAMTATKRMGIKDSLLYFDEFTERYFAEPEKYFEHLALIKTMLRENIIVLKNLGQNKASLDLNIKIVNTLEKGNALEECIKFLNFQVTSYATLGEYEEAERISNKAMELAKKYDNKDEILSTLQFRGSSFYERPDAYNYSDYIHDCWIQAYNIYKEEFADKDSNTYPLSRKIGTLIKTIIAHLIHDNVAEAQAIYLQVAKYLDNTRMPHYEIKLRLTRVMMLVFMDDSECNMQEGMHLMHQAIDICALHGDVIMYVDCFQLLAIFQMKYAKYELACENYTKALKLLLHTLSISTDIDFIKWQHFFLDMAICFRRTSKKISVNILKSIPNGGRINGKFMFKKLHATKILPIGIF